MHYTTCGYANLPRICVLTLEGWSQFLYCYINILYGPIYDDAVIQGLILSLKKPISKFELMRMELYWEREKDRTIK